VGQIELDDCYYFVETPQVIDSLIQVGSQERVVVALDPWVEDKNFLDFVHMFVVDRVVAAILVVFAVVVAAIKSDISAVVDLSAIVVVEFDFVFDSISANISVDDVVLSVDIVVSAVAPFAIVVLSAVVSVVALAAIVVVVVFVAVVLAVIVAFVFVVAE
jgi:hypothetical protein